VLNRDPNIDYLFNPSFIEQRTGSPPDLKYCIYTESEGYILNDVLSLDKSKQINPIIHFGDEGLLIRQLKEEFDRLNFGFTAGQIKEAIEFADNTEHAFKEEIYAEGEKFLRRIEAGNEKAYVGVGRDYVLLDPEASSNSGSMFSQIRGLDYIPQQFLEPQFENIALAGVVENEFWVQSVKILKANIFVADHPNLFAIRMMNFACGPDSLKIYQEEKIQQAAGKPLLVLLTDAQTNNAPFVTRTEAHERVVEQSKPQKLKIGQLKRRSRQGSEERTWLIPYMGDASCVGAAGLRYFGVDSVVLPTNTERGYEAARRHIYTEVCHPLKGVVGDAIGFLEEKIEDEGADYVKKHYLVMLPTTSGPCRFGKYTELVREFLDKEGLQDVPVAGPSSETDYLDIPFPRKLRSSDKMRMQRMLFKGIKGSDLLEDIFLRFHPYAEDKKAMAELRQQQLRELEKVVESGAETLDLVEWGKKTVSLFEACKLRNHERFPLVLYIGEIYMRMHDPYTDFVIRKLEDSGLEVVRDPVTDWLDYVNKMNVRNAKRDLGLRLKSFDLGAAKQVAGKYGKSILKSKYMSSVENKIAEPFHEVLHGRHVLPKPIEIINTLERHHEFHGNIEGESPLSAGIAYHIMNDLVQPHGDAYISGIFHVGPFTCMQEGVATAKMEAMAKELRKRKPDLVFPIIHAFFGDSAGANLDSEIAVFAEQCYQKRDMLREKHGQKAPSREVATPIEVRDIPRPEHSNETLTESKR
jgi:predicted nucleotide-binding protein (sugar kinase/HSP70/actin superfamily)